MADEVAVLKQGCLAQAGSPATIYKAPESLYVAQQFGSPPINVLRFEDAGPEEVRLVFSGQRFSRSLVRGKRPVIRPEDVHLGDHGSGIPCTVAMVEQLGSYSIVVAQRDGENLSIVLKGQSQLKEGDAVMLDLQTDKIAFIPN